MAQKTRHSKKPVAANHSKKVETKQSPKVTKESKGIVKKKPPPLKKFIAE